MVRFLNVFTIITLICAVIELMIETNPINACINIIGSIIALIFLNHVSNSNNDVEDYNGLYESNV